MELCYKCENILCDPSPVIARIDIIADRAAVASHGVPDMGVSHPAELIRTRGCMNCVVETMAADHTECSELIVGDIRFFTDLEYISIIRRG
jgi:hypothetical protein